MEERKEDPLRMHYTGAEYEVVSTSVADRPDPVHSIFYISSYVYASVANNRYKGLNIIK